MATSRRKAVGYLRGKGGEELTRGPEGALAQVRERAERIRGRVEVVASRIEELDRAIERVAALLRIAQPPMWGRVEIRWWQTGEDQREPVLVRIEPVRGGVALKAVRVKRPLSLRLRDDRGFGLNADLARAGVRLFAGLAARRKVLVAVLGKAQRALAVAEEGRMSGVSDEAGDAVVEAERLMEEARGRLKVMGYEV